MSDERPSTRRVIGRILSLGFPLPGPKVDNYSIISAPAFFDYDALVVDPSAVSQLLQSVLRGEAEASTFTGARVRAAPENAQDLALGDVIERRRDETARLLDNGGAVVCFLHPEAMHAIVEGARVGDYAWLPDSARAAFAATVRAEGTQAHVIDYQHPLAAFVAGQAANIAYRAFIDERALPGARAFVRSQGGAAIGVEVPLPRGRLFLVPAMRALPSGDARYTMSDTLQQGIRQALGAMAEGRAPAWVAEHALPGLADAQDAVDAARRDLDAAAERLASAEAARDANARYQRLLWQEGAEGIEDVLVDALKLIGCDVYASNREAFEMRIDGESVLFEVVSSERAIEMAAHHRLRQRIERAIESRGSAPRGVLFANGKRLNDPALRSGEISPQLKLAAETMRYCIAPTTTLFAAVAAKLGGDDETAVTYRHALVSTDGVLT